MYIFKVIRRDSCPYGITTEVKETEIIIEEDFKNEAFIDYFRNYHNRYRYCNSVRFEIIGDDVKKDYKEWLSNPHNYANNGGSMI